MADGAEAVRRYCEEYDAGRPFDAVIMDLTVPGGMGGKAAVQKILAINPVCKVIVSSGYSGDAIPSEYESYGFRGVIAKPYRLDDLRKTPNRMLAKQNGIRHPEL